MHDERESDAALRAASEAKWKANEAELARIRSAPGLDRVMLAKREEELLAEQDQIEWELGQPFNPEMLVADYRLVMGRLGDERTELGKADLQATAKRLRTLWKDWQGEDSLHEMAFGEPWE